MYLKTRARTIPSTIASGTCVTAKMAMNMTKDVPKPPTAAGYASASSKEVTTYVNISESAVARNTVTYTLTHTSFSSR